MRFQVSLFAVLVGVSLGLGCSNEGVAPASYLDEPHLCPDLDSMLPITIGMVERGELARLRAVLAEELDEPSQQLLIHMVAGVLKIIPPSRFSELAVLGESELISNILELLHDLLVAMNGLSPEVQAGFDEGLHRFTQSCPMEPLLHTLQRGSAHTDAIMEVLPLLFGGDSGALNNSSVDPASWLDLYVGVLEIAAALPGSEEDLKDLIRFVSALPGLESLEGLTVIFDDEVFLQDLGQVVTCLSDVEAAHGYGLLAGVAHISASQTIMGATDILSEMVGNAGDKDAAQETQVADPAGDALGALLQGMIESPDLIESLRYTLGWLFSPARASRMRGDLALLFGSGAVEELLNAVSQIGAHDCTLEDSAATDPPPTATP